jgi:hypothetical protein
MSATKSYTTKQMGDACEMLVAAELTLAGNPALKGPDYWPWYDVIAQPPGKEPQRISVKSRTFKKGAAFVEYNETDSFEWLAIVLLPGGSQTRRRMFVIPRGLADLKARRDKPTSKTAKLRYWRIDEVPTLFAAFEGNFSLGQQGTPTIDCHSEAVELGAATDRAATTDQWVAARGSAMIFEPTATGKTSKG